MVVDITRVGAAIRHLRLRDRDGLIIEAFLDEEASLADVKLFKVCANLLVGFIRTPDRAVPIGWVRAQQVTVDLILDDVSNFLGLREHVILLVEKSVLIRIIYLHVFVAADRASSLLHVQCARGGPEISFFLVLPFVSQVVTYIQVVQPLLEDLL